MATAWRSSDSPRERANDLSLFERRLANARGEAGRFLDALARTQDHHVQQSLRSLVLCRGGLNRIAAAEFVEAASATKDPDVRRAFKGLLVLIELVLLTNRT